MPLPLWAGNHVYVELAESAAKARVPTTATAAPGSDARLGGYSRPSGLKLLHRAGDEVVLGESDGVTLASGRLVVWNVSLRRRGRLVSQPMKRSSCAANG